MLRTLGRSLCGSLPSQDIYLSADRLVTMNIIIPMAGRGSRLSGHPSGRPKPLIEVGGAPLWKWAAGCLPLERASRLIFVCLAEHDDRYGLKAQIRNSYRDLPLEIVILDEVTDGQLRSVVEAADRMIPQDSLMIYNADTWFRHNLEEFHTALRSCAGLLGVSQRQGEQWSFARLGPDGGVVEVAEKRRISDFACTGLYYFSSTYSFLDDAARALEGPPIESDEHYVAPLYRRLIERGARVDVHLATEFFPIGTPAELEDFEKRVGGTRREP